MEICGRTITECIELKCKDAPHAEGMCAAHFAKVEKERRGTVYFVAAGEFVKIGYSTNMGVRLVDLRRAYNFTTPAGITDFELRDYRVLATETGGPDREARLHYHFRAYHAAGEWFERAPEILAYIDALNSSTELVSRALLASYDSGQHLIAAAIEAECRARASKRNGGAVFQERSAAVRAAKEKGIRTKTLARSLGIQSQRVVRMVSGRE